MEPEKSINIILESFINAIEDHCSFTRYYLDRETGEIIFQSERHVSDDDDFDDNTDRDGPADTAERFILIEPMETARGRILMKKFIDSLPEGKVRADLSSAVLKQKGYMHFKNVLHDRLEMQHQWDAFHAAEIIKIAEEWLQYKHINYEFVSIDDIAK